jgi:hypothetical protein
MHSVPVCGMYLCLLFLFFLILSSHLLFVANWKIWKLNIIDKKKKRPFFFFYGILCLPQRLEGKIYTQDLTEEKKLKIKLSVIFIIIEVLLIFVYF